MRSLKSVLTAALCGGLFFVADVADAQRLDTEFELEDQNDPNGNQGFLEISGTTAFVGGSVTGTGTAGDVVRIIYGTDTPTHVNADEKQARIRQSSFSTLFLVIESETPARDLELEVDTQKCQIDGKVQAEKGKGDVAVSCSADDLFSELSADQLASIQAAFLDDKQVKVKVKSDGSKGSVSIKLKGTATEAVDP